MGILEAKATELMGKDNLPSNSDSHLRKVSHRMGQIHMSSAPNSTKFPSFNVHCKTPKGPIQQHIPPSQLLVWIKETKSKLKKWDSQASENHVHHFGHACLFYVLETVNGRKWQNLTKTTQNYNGPMGNVPIRPRLFN